MRSDLAPCSLRCLGRSEATLIPRRTQRKNARPYLFDARSAAFRRTTGWERYAREIARRLRQDGEVDVYQGGGAGPAQRLWQDAVAIPALTRGHRLVHFPTFPPVPWAGASAITVYTLHDLTWWRYRETASRAGRMYYRRLADRALQRCHIVTPSQAVADEAVRLLSIPRDQITVVHGGSDLPEPRRRPPELPGQFLLAVATQEPRKNLQRLVDAYRSASLSDDFELMVVGRAAWGEPPRGVRVVSDLTDQQLADYYAAARGVVAPSLYEGFGLPVVEALRMGTPVACSDLPVFHEVAGNDAVFFDPLDASSIAAGLVRLVNAPRDRPEAVARARRFTWDAAAAALSALYRRLAS